MKLSLNIKSKSLGTKYCTYIFWREVAQQETKNRTYFCNRKNFTT